MRTKEAVDFVLTICIQTSAEQTKHSSKKQNYSIKFHHPIKAS